MSRRQFIDQHTYLPDQILAVTDRMSMAKSLEVRVPFMDYRLVRLTQRVPGKLKQNSGDFKILLKKTLGQRCPPEILARPKWGFDTPCAGWVSNPGFIILFEVCLKAPRYEKDCSRRKAFVPSSKIPTW